MLKNNEAPNRNSWFVRIMSVVCACILWVYVMNEQNPITTKVYQVPLVAQNLSDDMVVKELPDTVSVKVSGTRSQIAQLGEGDVKAFIDFTDAPKGRNTYNVQASVRMGEVTEISPSLIQLETDTVAEKTMSVEPRIVGVPNSGVTVSQMDLNPTRVTIPRGQRPDFPGGQGDGDGGYQPS
jgi:YbbR domain-containing protein